MATLIDPAVIEQEAVRSSSEQLARALQDMLGQKTAAYVTGLSDAKMVGRWAKGSNAPTETARLRLQYAFHVSRLIEQAYGDETAKAWLWGSNSRLEREAPAFVLRHAESIDDLRSLVPAAIAFVADAG